MTSFSANFQRCADIRGQTPVQAMRAIARVNRVFRDKPDGLVVDYLGLADQLKKALVTYTESGNQGEAYEFCREIRDLLIRQ